MKKNILGGKSNSCPMCGGDMVFVRIGKVKVISQCKCGCTMDGRVKDEIKIYNFDFEEVKQMEEVIELGNTQLDLGYSIEDAISTAINIMREKEIDLYE